MTGIPLILFASIIYFAPTLIASFRGHHNANPIFVINLFAGWTVVGWIGCLAWSLSSLNNTN